MLADQAEYNIDILCENLRAFLKLGLVPKEQEELNEDETLFTLIRLATFAAIHGWNDFGKFLPQPDQEPEFQ